MTETTKVKPIRATDEVIKRFNALTENFSNQGAALEALINAWEIQNAKSAVPERESDIADFDSHMQSIQRAFVHSLELAQNADARAMDTYRRKLETLEAEKEELRRKLEQSETTARFMTGHRDNALKERDQEQARADAAEKRAATLEAALESEKAHAAAQIADKEKLANSLTAQVAEQSNRIRENAAAVAKAESLKKDLDTVKRQLADAQTAAQIAEAKALADKTLAVSAARQEANTRLLELTNENAALRVELEKLKAEVAASRPTPAKNPALMNDQRTAPTPKTPRKKAAAKKADATPTSDAATMGDANAQLEMDNANKEEGT